MQWLGLDGFVQSDHRSVLPRGDADDVSCSLRTVDRGDDHRVESLDDVGCGHDEVGCDDESGAGVELAGRAGAAIEADHCWAGSIEQIGPTQWRLDFDCFADRALVLIDREDDLGHGANLAVVPAIDGLERSVFVEQLERQQADRPGADRDRFRADDRLGQ